MIGRFDHGSIVIRWDSSEICSNEFLFRNAHELGLAFLVLRFWILVVLFDHSLMLFVDECPKNILPILISFIEEFFPFEVFLVILVIFTLTAYLSEHNAEHNENQQ